MESYTVIRENWLTRKIDATAAAHAALITLAVVLGSLMFWGGHWHADQWMAANGTKVFVEHQWWRAWTTLFVHADLRHLLSNAFLFFIVGVFLSGYFGTLVFPFAAFLFGGLVNLVVLKGMPPETELVGASGVVFWMGGFWLVLYFLLDRRRSIFQRALRAGGVALGLFMPAEAFDPSISYSSHLYGFISGAGFGLLYYFGRRREFLAAEVSETIVEDDEILSGELEPGSEPAIASTDTLN